MADVPVYVFSSQTLTNIWAGIGARRWAVSEQQGTNASIRTKASQLPVGGFGILYCTELQSLTTPFVILSKPLVEMRVGNVWQGEWLLPFSIFPLGSPDLVVHKDALAQLLPSLRGGGGQRWDQIFHVQGLTAFAASQVDERDWAALITKLVA